MSKQIYEKIEFNVKYKLPFIIMYLITTIIAICAVKDHITISLGYEQASSFYLTIFGLSPILIILILSIIANKWICTIYPYVNTFVKDCNDNITPLMMLNTPIAAYYAIQLYNKLTFANFGVFILLYICLFVSPLLSTKAMIVIYNIIIDLLIIKPELTVFERLKELIFLLWQKFKQSISLFIQKYIKLIKQWCK